MSKTRILLRLLLVAAICGVLWLGYRTWARSQPDFYWSRAQAAIEVKEWQEARLNLQNLLQKYPTHGEGLRAMAEVQLEEARASDEIEGRELNYAQVPAALSFLASAAENLPEDDDLQQQVLAALIFRGQMADAAQVAKQVLKTTPDHADALYAVAFAAVDAENVRDAEAAFEKLRTANSRRVFSTFALWAQMYRQNNEEDKASEVLREALQVAKRLKPDQLELLTRRDRDIMAELLVQATQLSQDGAMATSRVDDGLSVLEIASEKKLLDAGQIAMSAARMSLVLDMKFPLKADDTLGKSDRAKLAHRAAALGTASTESNVAEPAIYYQAALAEFSKGGNEAAQKGFDILEKGIKACQDIDEERREEVLNLNLLLARRYVRARKFDDAERHIRVLLQNEHSSGWAHLLAGAVAISEGKHEQALEQYKRAQRELGNTILIRMGLANCHLTLMQWDEALPHLDELHVSLSDLDEEEKAWVERELGNAANVHLGQLTALLALDEWDKAQPHLEALKTTPLAESAWTMAVGHLWKKEQRTQARTLLTQLRKKYPSSVRLLQADAQMLIAVGMKERIPPLIEKFAEDNPDLLLAQLMVVRQHLSAKDAQGALDRLDKIPQAIYSNPNEKRAVNALRAQALFALDRADAALALADTLDDDQAKLIGAAVKVQEEDLKGAAKLVEQAGGRSGYLKMLEGQLLAQQGDYGSAVDAFAKSLDVTAIRSAARGQVMKALMLLAAKQGPEAAERKTDELLKIYPDDSVLLIAKGEFKVQQRQFDEALDLFDQVEKWDPNVATGPYLKAAVWLKRKDWAKAFSEAQRALAIDPDHPLALVAASQASLADRQFTRAAQIAATGIAAHPKNWSMIQLRYQALRALEKKTEGTALLTDTMKKHPELAQAYLVRGGELIEAKKEAEAITLYREGYKAAPEAFGLVVAEVGLLARKGDHAAAKSAAIRQFDEEKMKAGNALALGQAFAAATLWETGAEWGKKALKLAADNDNEKAASTLFLGDIALKEAMVDKVEAKYPIARDYFAEVLELFPNHFVAGNNLAWLLATKYDKAQEAADICDKVRGDAEVDVMPVAFIDTLCEVYRRCGREDDARRVVEAALKAHPDTAVLQFHLGILLAKRDAPTASQALASAIKGGLPAEQEKEAKRVLATLSP